MLPHRRRWINAGHALFTNAVCRGFPASSLLSSLAKSDVRRVHDAITKRERLISRNHENDAFRGECACVRDGEACVVNLPKGYSNLRSIRYTARKT